MQLLLISILFFALSIGSGYFVYFFYTSNINGHEYISLVFLILCFVFIITGLVLVFRFTNRKLRKDLKDKEQKLKVWSDISVHVKGVGDEVVTDLPVGIIVYDESLGVQWTNEFAEKQFLSDKAERSISSISRELADKIVKKEETILITYNNLFYEVIHNDKNKSLYFFDATDRENTKIIYNNKMTAIGVLGIDNLEGALKKSDIQETANMRAQILGEISDWIRNYHCYIQTLPNDRMAIIMDQETLLKMVEDKFSVLGKVREIAQKNRTRASISMGIACYDVDSEELGALAQSAFDLAEKRGGDQVVVNIHDKKVEYFGGNSNSLEKNSLVEARQQTLALKDAIEAAENVICMCHNRADCDALGSMLGVYHLVLSSNKPVKMAFEPRYADVTVKKIIEQIKTDEPNLMNSFITEDEAVDLITPETLLIITDTQSPRLLMFTTFDENKQPHNKILDKVSKFSVVDHHRAGDAGYETDAYKPKLISYYVDTAASSAVELISDMFVFYNTTVTFSLLEASIMLAGIIVDTNNFTYRAAAHTFEAASTLKNYGADMIFVRKLLREPMDVEREIANAVNKTDILGKHFAIVSLPEDDIITDSTSLAKISDKLLTIEGVDTSFTIGKYKNQAGGDVVGISARSLEGTNVQSIMEEMGGGGHYNAAATQKYGMTVAEVKEELVNILKLKYIDDGEDKMKVILLEDVKGKGKKNEEKEVPNGYGNYLITNNLAVMATDENRAKLAKMQAEEKALAEAKRKVLLELKKDIEGKLIVVAMKMGADGKNYSKITTKLVCDEFNAQTKILLDKKKIELPADINSVGIYDVSVKLDKDIVAVFQVKVTEK